MNEDEECGDGDVVALSTSSFNFLDPSHQLWALKLGFMVNTVHEIDSGDTLDKPTDDKDVGITTFDLREQLLSGCIAKIVCVHEGTLG